MKTPHGTGSQRVKSTRYEGLPVWAAHGAQICRYSTKNNDLAAEVTLNKSPDVGCVVDLKFESFALAKLPRRAGQFTALVVGSGATGVELATELPARLRAAAEASGSPVAVGDIRVILADGAAQISGCLGGARAVIELACAEMSIEVRMDFALKSVDDRGVVLADGRRIEASTVVCFADMAASPLNERMTSLSRETPLTCSFTMEESTMDARLGFFVNRDLAGYEVPVHPDIQHQQMDFMDEIDPISSPVKTKRIARDSRFTGLLIVSKQVRGHD